MGAFPRLEPTRTSDLLLHAVFRLTTFDSATVAALGRLFRMVLPLPLLVFRHLGGDPFLEPRGRNLSFGTLFVTYAVIIQVLVVFQICCVHPVTAIEIVPWRWRIEEEGIRRNTSEHTYSTAWHAIFARYRTEIHTPFSGTPPSETLRFRSPASTETSEGSPEPVFDRTSSSSEVFTEN